jgi:proliferating cell nuclear antigen PCNA
MKSTFIAKKIEAARQPFSTRHTYINMEITPNDSSLFRASIEALKEFLPQAQLQVTSEGVRMSGMDASHVGFVDYLLAKADCETLTSTKSYSIGINMSILARTLSAVGHGDRVTLSLGKSKDKLIVSYTNEKISKKAVYEVAMLDITEDAMDLPELTYAANVRAKTMDISSAIKEVSHFGDCITLRLDEEGFHMSTSGDAGKARQTLENTEDRDMELTEDFVEAAFGTKYLSTIMKAGSPLSSVTQLEFDASQPLRASFKFGNGSHFIAYLAPKITDE